MLTWREYEFCRLIASGDVEGNTELAARKAFNISGKQSKEQTPQYLAREDIQAMLDFISGEMGRYEDEMTRLVKLRRNAYELASDPDLKGSERAQMMTQYTKLTAEINKAKAREEEAIEDVESLLKDLKGAKRVIQEEEVIEHGKDQEGDQEVQGRRQDVLGGDALEQALNLV